MRDGDIGIPASDVSMSCARLLLESDRLKLGVGIMSDYIDDAKKQAEEGMSLFDEAHDSLLTRERALIESSKRASGNIRKSCNDLANGLEKLERSANFDRLERLAETLERAATAVEALAKLDREGRLERIAAILK